MSLRHVYMGPMPDSMNEVLERANIGFTISSNFARENAVAVALAASNGWVSTITRAGRGFSSWWGITTAGMTILEHEFNDQ